MNFVGFPGEPQEIIVANVFKGDDLRNEGGPGGSSGLYQVVFVLNRPGYRLVPEYQFSFVGPLNGGSHLAITRPAFSPPDPKADRIRIYAATPDGKFEFTAHPNHEGFLGKIETEPFHALNRRDAQRKAYRALLPALSQWSVHLDIPLEVEVIETMELRTGNPSIRVTAPFLEAPFAVQAESPEWDSEFGHYAGLYREGLNSSSPIYRFLCLFKIIEGVQVRRARLGAEAAKRRETFTRPFEAVPSDPNEFIPSLTAVFPIKRDWDALAIDSIFISEAVGKRFGQMIASNLRPLRDRVAHAFLKSGEITISVDELLHIEQVNHWLPLARYMARRMLKNEFPTQFLPYLKENGAVVARTNTLPLRG